MLIFIPCKPKKFETKIQDKSLHDHMYVGSVMTTSLIGILYKFREWLFAAEKKILKRYFIKCWLIIRIGMHNVLFGDEQLSIQKYVCRHSVLLVDPPHLDTQKTKTNTNSLISKEFPWFVDSIVNRHSVDNYLCSVYNR